jgi:DNA mismatch endonuclease, patch repair protein
MSNAPASTVQPYVAWFEGAQESATGGLGAVASWAMHPSRPHDRAAAGGCRVDAVVRVYEAFDRQILHRLVDVRLREMDQKPSTYPVPSSAAASAVMRANRKTDTSPELRLRSELWRQGLRFRKHYRISVPGLAVVADLVFVRARVAVFVDGCFWHRCPAHGSSPRANSTYWKAKLERNHARDLAVTKAYWLQAGRSSDAGSTRRPPRLVAGYGTRWW